MIGGLINFHKRRLIYDVILEIQQYQQTPYNLQEVFQIQQFIANYSVWDNDQIFQQSLVVEPRNIERSELQ